MKIAHLILACLLAACATPARAQNRLEVFGALEGCWIGTFAESNGLQDQRCFTRIHEGRQWRDVHAVIGTGYGGETIYAFDAEANRIAVVYYANDGGLMRGHGDVVRGGINFPDARYVGADGNVQELRSFWSLAADGEHYDVTTERRENGEWRPFMRIAYTRTSGPGEETPAH